MSNICTVEGCEKKRKSRIGYCSAHYAKYKQYGDPLAGRTNKFSPGETPQLCTIEGCGAKHSHSGLCASHNNRKRKLGSPYALYESEKRPDKVCAVDSCDRKHYCKGFCTRHYQNWFKYGDPLFQEKNGPMGWINRHKDYQGDECLTWPFGKLVNGYGTVKVSDGRKRIASRVMCEVAHGKPPEDKMQAAHNCGKGHEGCVNPSHLRWDTVKGNAADKEDHGTLLYGERAPWAKLNNKDVAEIVSLKGVEHVQSIADRFGVTRWAVYNIWQGRRWTRFDG